MITFKDLFAPRRIVVVVLGIAVAGCQMPPQRPMYPEVGFAHLHPIGLNVASVEVVQAYSEPLRWPNVEHEAPVPPSRAAVRWAQDRLQPQGVRNLARVIIEDASIVAEPLEPTGGIRGVFTTDQAYRLNGRTAVRVEILDENLTEIAFASAEARRVRSVPENATLNERDRVLFEMTEEMMRDFNVEMEKAMRRFLVDHVR